MRSTTVTMTGAGGGPSTALILDDPSEGWRARHGAGHTVEVLPEEGAQLVDEHRRGDVSPRG